MTPYRQEIRRGDVGSDVLAVKRVLRRRGVTGLRMDKRAGPRFVYGVERVQRNHGLKADGVYGKLTHAIVAVDFDAYGRLLYRTAKLRRHDPARGGVGGSWFTWYEIGGHGKFVVPIVLRAGATRQAKRLQVLNDAVNEERHKHGLEPTKINTLSWYRPLWYNRQIGGARLSKHILAVATDIAREEVGRLCPWHGGELDFDALANRIYSGGGFGQYPSGSRHVDSRGYRARWSSF